MSEYADKHNGAHRKGRVDHVLRSTSGKVDASGYEVPGEMETQKKTGPCQPKPRAFAKGGKVEGEASHRHAGRKARESGGETAVQALRPSVPTGGLYGSGFSPTHAGMLGQAAGFKKGGQAKKRADGGMLPGEAARQAKASANYKDSTNWVAKDRASGLRDSDPVAKADTENQSDNLDRLIGSSQQTGYSFKKGGEAKRHKRADGGRAKGKTNINIIIAQKPDAAAGAVPPPPSAVPPGMMPKPGLPPAAMGAMQPPGMGGPPPGPMPSQMPQGAMPRARGGRAS